jgi:hypothetical protein
MSKQPVITWAIFRVACVAVIGLLDFASASAQMQPPPRYPPENPPSLQIEESTASSPALKPDLVSAAPTTQWTWHKTADNSHPDGREQQVIWLMNRARFNPHAEGAWLASSTDPDVAGGRDWFGVNKTMLQNAFDSYTAKPPAAFDARLYNAAKAHSDYLLTLASIDGSNAHTGQFERITAAGFTCGGGSGYSTRGNVFAFAESGLNAHAAWNIDWGGSNGGMQQPPGHRMAIMSIDGDYTNVGVALVYGNNPSSGAGPYVTTGNYCHASSVANQYNQFIVGTVWRDLDWDGMYDPGEGIGGIIVTPDSGTYYAITSNSGGYTIPVTMATGNHSVTFSGSGINDLKNVTIGSVSVLLDYIFLPVFTDFVFLPVVQK